MRYKFLHSIYNKIRTTGIILVSFFFIMPLAYAAPSTQGIASLTPPEIHRLAKYYSKESDESRVINKIINTAKKALQKKPAPLAKVITSGSSIKTNEKSNSKEAEEQANAVYSLALAYVVTGKEAYFDKAKYYLVSWAHINQPDGDSVAGEKFIPMFLAYDLIRNKLNNYDKGIIDRWLKRIGKAIITDQKQAKSENSQRGINNHRSHALLILATIGCVTGEQKFIHYVTDKGGFLSHIGRNLASFAGEPAGAGVDYHQRKAYHYVAYNLQALGKLAIILDRLSHLPGNPYGINYNPYMVEVEGASILKTLGVLLPYAAGEKRNMAEFDGTENKNDLKRLESGSLQKTFNRKDAIPALEAANYFFIAVQNPSSGQKYNLPQITLDIILETKGSSSMPATFPTPQFLINRITSPYLQSEITKQ